MFLDMTNFKGKLVAKKELTHDVIQFDIKSIGEFSHKSGQFIMVDILDGKEPKACRAYSIATRGGIDNKFSLVVKILPDGRGSQFLAGLDVGAELSLSGPFGHFVLDETSKKETVFIATGTGIAPINAMIEEHGDKAILFWGLRHEEDIFWEDKYKNIDFKLTLSQPKSDFKGLVGRVTDILPKTNINFKNIRVYMCGNKAMTDQMKQLLSDKGVPPEDIKCEIF